MPSASELTLCDPEGATVAECPEEYLAAMDENGGIEDAGRQGSIPVLVGLPVRPQCPWTLESEHAVNIKGGQVGAYLFMTVRPVPFLVLFADIPADLRSAPPERICFRWSLLLCDHSLHFPF